MRLRLARLEGAAKRLLDVLGHPADSSKGPEATLEALRAAANAEMEPQMDGDERGCESKWRF